MPNKSYLSIYAKSFSWAGFFLPKKTLKKCSPWNVWKNELWLRRISWDMRSRSVMFWERPIIRLSSSWTMLFKHHKIFTWCSIIARLEICQNIWPRKWVLVMRRLDFILLSWYLLWNIFTKWMSSTET